MQFLGGEEAKRPRAVLDPPSGDLGEDGAVVPSFEEGALVLRDSKGEYVRLSWETLEGRVTPKDRRRALAPGKYTLTGYRILRRDEKGRVWHVSATAPAIRQVRVRSGEETRIEIDPTIRVGERIQGRQLGMTIRGEKAGLSIYVDGKRIPIGYRVLSADDRVLAEGVMRYG